MQPMTEEQVYDPTLDSGLNDDTYDPTIEISSTENAETRLLNPTKAAGFVSAHDGLNGTPSNPAQNAAQLEAGSTFPIDRSFETYLQNEISASREQAFSAAMGGDAGKAKFFADYSKAQEDLRNSTQSLSTKLFKVTKNTHEQLAATGPYPPRDASDVAKLNRSATNTAAGVSWENFVGTLAKDAVPESYVGKAATFVQFLATEMTPWGSYEEFGIVPNAIAEITGLDRQRSAEEAVLQMRRYINTLDRGSQQELLTNLYELLKTKGNDFYAFSVIASIADPNLDHDKWYELEETPFFLKTSEKLAAAGLVADVALVGGIVRAAGAAGIRGLKALSLRGKLSRVMKETRGSEEVAEQAFSTALRGGDNALGVSKTEALEMARAHTLNNIIGTSLDNVNQALGKRIRQDALDAIEGMRSLLFSSGKTDDEVAAAIKEASKQVAQNNPHVLNVLPVEASERGVSVQIVHGNDKGQLFKTREEAEAYAKTLSGATKIIEAKSNTGFAVALDKIPTLEEDVATLRELVLKNNATRAAEETPAGRAANSGVGVLSGKKIDNPAYSSLFTRSDEDRILNGPVNAAEIVDALADGSKDPIIQKIAQRLRQNDAIDLSNVQLTPMSQIERSSGPVGLYRTIEDTLGYDVTKFKNGVPDEATALHEVIHSVVTQTIDAIMQADRGSVVMNKANKAVKFTTAQQTAVRKLDRIFRAMIQSDFAPYGNSLRDVHEIYLDAIQSGLGIVGENAERLLNRYYGLTDVHEMVAEALSNREFMKTLQKIPLSELFDAETIRKEFGGGKRSVWDAITEFIVEMFKGSKAEPTALSAVLENSWKLIDSAKEDQRTLISSLVAQGKLPRTPDGGIRFPKLGKPHIKVKARKVLEDMLAAKEQELIELKALKDEGFQGYGVVQVREDPTMLKAVGGFDPTDIASMNRILGFDDKHMSSSLLVDQFTAAWHVTAGNRRILTDFYKKAIDPLNSKERNALYSILSEGDTASNFGGLGKEFSATEIASKLADHFTPAQVEKITEGYIRTRVLRNMLHDIKDEAGVRTLKARGYDQHVQFSLDGTSQLVGAGKVLADPSSLKGGKIFSVALGKHVDVDDELLTTLKSGKVKVVELSEAEQVGGVFVRRFFDEADKVNAAEIRSIIPRRPGEFQRIYDDPFFISVNGTRVVDGVSEAAQKTLRTAKNNAEAEAYVKGFNLLLDAKKRGVLTLDLIRSTIGKWEDPDSFYKLLMSSEMSWADEAVLRVSRSKDEYMSNFVDAVSSNGMLFNGSRNEKLVPIDNPVRANTLSVEQSLAAELTSVSRLMSVYELRASAIQRWHNHGVETGALPAALRSMSPQDAFVAYRRVRLSALSDNRDKLFSERAWQYINEQLGAKTAHEQKIQEYQEFFSQKLLNNPNAGWFRKQLGMYLRESSSVDDLRGLTSHLTLGTLNIGQLFVQMAGASVAAVLHPVHGVSAAMTALPLRVALMFDNPAMWRRVARLAQVGTLGFTSVNDFVELVQAVKKSGIISGIQSTADYTKTDGAFNLFSRTKGAAAETSYFFFNRGEEFSRLISFDIARRILKEKGDVNLLDDFVLRKAIQMEDDFTQNMTKGNQAWFTRGAVGVPLQFMQYSLKFVGNFTAGLFSKKGLERGFTRAEWAKIVTGMTVLYGVSNMGMGDLVEETLGESFMNSLDIKDPDARYNARLAVSEGIIAATINLMSEHMFGTSTRLSVGKRLSPFGFSEIAEELVNNEKDYAEVLLGASMRTIKAIAGFGPFLRTLVKNDEATPRQVLSDLADIAASASSQFNNAQKVWLYANNQNKLITSTGQYIAPLSTSEVWAKLIGFSSVPLTDYYRLRKDEIRYKKHIEENVGKWLAQQRVKILTAYNAGDTELGDTLQRRYDLMMPDRNTIEWDYVQKYLERTKPTHRAAIQDQVTKLLEKSYGRTVSNSAPFTATKEQYSTVPLEKNNGKD